MPVSSPTHPQNSGKSLFENVWFKYQNSGQYALKGVSFEIEGKERVCIVGRNGAGKSTVLNLIMRLYDPQKGRILIDGVDLRELNVNSLRSQIAAYTQDANRYYFTVRDNIVFGDIERPASNEAIARAIDDTNLGAVVSRMPMREETILGQVFGGEDISHGEWQRLMIARVFYRQASLYMLDEATSALDAENERAILSYFEGKLEGKLSITISHQLSTVRTADKIIVLDGGEVDDIGNHHELIDRNGVYGRLFSLQKMKYVEPN